MKEKWAFCRKIYSIVDVLHEIMQKKEFFKWLSNTHFEPFLWTYYCDKHLHDTEDFSMVTRKIVNPLEETGKSFWSSDLIGDMFREKKWMFNLMIYKSLQ